MDGCTYTKSDHQQLTITRRMAIANGMCVSFCNQPKAQFDYLRRVTPVCRCLHPFCGWWHLATSRRESKAHFGFPWVHPWDNHGKCYIDGKRIQCLSNASQHVVQKFAILAHFFAHFGGLVSPGYAPGTIAVNVTWVERRFIAGQTHCNHVPIYLQPFRSYSEILVENCNFFLPPCI